MALEDRVAGQGDGLKFSEISALNLILGDHRRLQELMQDRWHTRHGLARMKVLVHLVQSVVEQPP